MKKNFLMLNFCTEYSSKGNTNVKMRKAACFSSVFYSARNGLVQKNRYILKLYKNGDMLNEKKQNNAVFLSREDIVRHLKALKLVFKFSYYLKEKEDHFVLRLLIKNNLIYHKYLLSWVRYLYEYPFNMFLLDAFRLKKLPEFKFESLINLFNLVGASSGICIHGTDIHAIGNTSRFKEILTIEEIKDSLRQLHERDSRVNDVFNYYVYKNGNEKLDILVESNEREFACSEYWESLNAFNKRVELYKRNYKILKSKKK